MTRQVPDGMRYEGDDYVILYGPAQFGFEVHDHSLFPIGRNSANHRGYWCECSVVGGRLTLDELHVNNAAGYYPSTLGAEAEARRDAIR